MFELFLEKQKTENTSSSKGDRITEIVTVLGKVLKFLCLEPYKGLKYRIKFNPNHLKYLAILQLLTLPLYIYLGDEAVIRFIIMHSLDRILPEWVLDSRFFLFLGFVSHMYLLITRLPQMRQENLCNQKLKKLGLVSASNKDEEIRLISEIPLDSDQKRLILSNPGIPKSSYEAKKEAIEARFDCIVSNIDYGNSKKIIHIDYREKDFPKLIPYEGFYMGLNMRPYEFAVGTAINGKKITTTLKEMVHLLVAGETSGGKSTFLRQALLSLLTKNTKLQVFIIDLKRGVEGNIFKKDPRVHVIAEIDQVGMVLSVLNDELDERLKLLEEAEVNDIDAYEEKNKCTLSRYILIIDECAEIFIPSSTLNQAERDRIQQNKFKMGRLTRLARAAGIHLILSTQRPSKDAIDMQTKDNMVSRLCFRVNNNYVSQMVLDNGQASDLDKNAKGRAIWKEGAEQLEVQIPFISADDTKNILEKLTVDTRFLDEEKKVEPTTAVDDLTK